MDMFNSYSGDDQCPDFDYTENAEELKKRERRLEEAEALRREAFRKQVKRFNKAQGSGKTF